jgi:hypothetical protein
MNNWFESIASPSFGPTVTIQSMVEVERMAVFCSEVVKP